MNEELLKSISHLLSMIDIETLSPENQVKNMEIRFKILEMRGIV